MENGGERVIPRTALAGQGSGVVAQVSYGGLTSVERSLVEHAGRGEWLDLAAGDEAVDEAAMRSWGESRSCRASVIRDILRGRLAADIDPHGVRLRGARVTGRLDLENLTTDVCLELEDCLLEEGVVARDARLPARRSHRRHPRLWRSTIAQRIRPRAGRRRPASRPAHVPALVQRHGGGEGAAVNLKGAQVGGMLQFAPERLEHKDDSRRRLAADGLSYSGVPGRISAEDWRELLREGTLAMPHSRISNWPQDTGRWATTGRPAGP